MTLYDKVVKLAYEKKGLRPHLLPLIKEAKMQKKAGHTHYWEILEPFDMSEWGHLLREAENIIKAAERDGISIAGGHGTGKPMITDTHISLNGDKSSTYIPEWAQREDNPEVYRTSEMHETFYFKNLPESSFTKTNSKPYDAVVVSILAAAKRIAPNKIDVASDGGSSAIKRVY